MSQDEKYIEEFIKDIPFDTENKPHHDALQRQLLSSFPKHRLQTISKTSNVWRIIMRKPKTKLAAAAVVIIGVSFGLQIFDGAGRAMAAEVFAQAIEAMVDLRSVHIKARMRTLPHDNFELIRLDHEFVPHDLWKEYGPGVGKWRVEKPGRVVVMDGQGTLLFIRPNYAAKGGIRTGFVSWLKPLLDVDGVLDSEIKRAQQERSELVLSHETGADGRKKLVVTVEAIAKGDFTHDWLRNKSIPASDNYRVYCFDAETKLLETLHVYVHVDDKVENDVLVFEITNIEYNRELAPDLFTLELPEDVIWHEQAQPLEDEYYQQMGPKEVATALFQACADEDWEEADKFLASMRADKRLQEYLGGLEIINIGEPFKSGQYGGWFVPYEIRLRSGHVKKHNLAVRNDNPGNRYVFDGGI